ncbi:hypothetical protein [Terricaulis sp.]|uniref:hypothetical protein n=1 Tax=Terricaulis sp. TaxID=2768686 RepID=UPI0037831537
MDGLLAKMSPFVATALSTNWLHSDTAKVLASFLLIIVVLVWLATIYRGGAGDEEIEKPVSLCLLSNCEENTLTLAPRHLKERTAHNTKAPRVQFFLQIPGRKKYERLALEKPLRLLIRGRNTQSVYDHEYARDLEGPGKVLFADGGQLGIDSDTRDQLEEYFREIFRREGRRFDADTATFVVKLKYPISLNLNYLLREHPDPSVRVGAWIFVLTSLFTIVQEWIFKQ